MIAAFTVTPYERPVVLAGGPRGGWHLRLEDAFGRVGFGDAAPWPGFGPTVSDVSGDLSALSARVRDGATPGAALFAGYPAVVVHAVSLALADLESQRRGLPLSALYGAVPVLGARTHVLVDDADEAASAIRIGATTLKLKLGRRPLVEDLARVARVRAAAPGAALRLDVNGRWTRAQAEAAFDALLVHRPDWIEQPLPAADFEGHGGLAQRFSTPIALDESVVLDPGAAMDVASVMVLKPMFLGDLAETMALALAAQARTLGVCLTHALGSKVERVGVQHLAAALADDAVHGVGRPVDGDRVALSLEPGLGVSP